MSIITIERHFLDHASHQKRLLKFYTILTSLQKLIRQKVIRAGLNDDIIGATSETNASGETVQALDVYSNNVVKEIYHHTNVFLIWDLKKKPML